MRHWLLLGVIVATTAAAASPAAQSIPASIDTLVARYASGDHVAAGEVDARTLVEPFTAALDGWIDAGGAERRQRRVVVAAAFALDAAWTATRTYDHLHLVVGPGRPDFNFRVDSWPLSISPALGRVAEWVVKRLPSSSPAEDLERRLWLTAVGSAEEARSWRRLQAEILPLAQKRLPNEPRVRLAGVVARTTIALGTLRVTTGLIHRNDLLRDEPRSTQWSHWKRELPKAVREFEPVLTDPQLGSEAHLRTGYLYLRLREWPEAIRHLDSARISAREPFLVAAANYFAGFVYELDKKPADAIASYRRAIEMAPGMRNLSTRLAALLYLRNERTEAYTLLEAAHKTPAPVDLLVALDSGDSRFVPGWLEEIRRAIK